MILSRISFCIKITLLIYWLLRKWLVWWQWIVCIYWYFWYQNIYWPNIYWKKGIPPHKEYIWITNSLKINYLISCYLHYALFNTSQALRHQLKKKFALYRRVSIIRMCNTIYWNHFILLFSYWYFDRRYDWLCKALLCVSSTKPVMIAFLTGLLFCYTFCMFIAGWIQSMTYLTANRYLWVPVN